MNAAISYTVLYSKVLHRQTQSKKILSELMSKQQRVSRAGGISHNRDEANELAFIHKERI
jgi:heme exporter protein D